MPIFKLEVYIYEQYEKAKDDPKDGTGRYIPNMLLKIREK